MKKKEREKFSPIARTPSFDFISMKIHIINFIIALCRRDFESQINGFESAEETSTIIMIINDEVEVKARGKI